MKSIRLKSKLTPRLALLCLPILAIAGFVCYLRQPPAYLIGRWKVEVPIESRNKGDLAAETILRRDRTWETVSPDPTNPTNGSFLVFKGQYSTDDSGFRLFGHKRFFRAQRADEGNDEPFIPIPNPTLGDLTSWEIYNIDQEIARKGEDYHVMNFDEKTRKMITEDETEFGGTKPRIERRTWIKQP